jgi:hypothetical protein
VQILDQNSARLGTSEYGDYFGHSLAADDFNSDGRDDLAIGVPGVVVDGVNLAMAGEVDIIYGSTAGLSTTVLAPRSFISPWRTSQAVPKQAIPSVIA